MTPTLVTAIGLVAAFLTTTSFLPQSIKTIRSRSTKDISLPMYIMFSSGVFLWLVYGILTKNVPVIYANGVTLPIVLTVLGYKLKHG